MPAKKAKGSKPRSPYTLDQAWQKIVEAPRFIQHHGGLTPTEESRIQDGFDILQESNRPSPTMVGNYWQFLKRVEKDSGSEMVGLCAAALGRTAIGRMKDRLRVELALKMKENQASLHCEAVNKAVQAIKQKRKHPQTRDLGTLTGDVYELTKDDARMIANSDQIGGKIWLTDPYVVNTASFITIPISDELKTQFIIQRPKVM